MKLFDVVTINKCLDIMKENFNKTMPIKNVTIIESLNRYLAEDIESIINVPHFRKSLVDGYAVLHSDVFLASDENAVPLSLIGESKMGKMCDIILEEETCVYVPTGGMVPNNATGMIMIEYTQKLDDETILIQKGVSINENIIEIGEDIKENEMLYKKGHYITDRDLGVLAGANIKSVPVFDELTAGIISTGDEILDVNEDIYEAKIKDINSYILYGQFKNISCNPIIYPPAKDNLQEIINLIDKAVNECDIVLISGGSSVGKKDETLKAIESFEDSKVLVEGIAIKPGKPTIIATIKDKLVIGLPGHPLSCAFVVESIVKPFILSLYSNKEEKYTFAEFEYNYHKARGREEFMPVNLIEKDKKIVCSPILTKSSAIKSFANCHGYVKIDRDLEGIHKGEIVKVYLLS